MEFYFYMVFYFKYILKCNLILLFSAGITPVILNKSNVDLINTYFLLLSMLKTFCAEAVIIFLESLKVKGCVFIGNLLVTV